MKKTYENILALALGLLLWGCNTQVTPPPRAVGIPMDAVWAGGTDGGAWFKSRQQGRLYYCQVFNDQTGDVWAEGFFKAAGNLEKMAKDNNLKYEWFDGKRIQLEGGVFLEPVQGRVEYPVPKMKSKGR